MNFNSNCRRAMVGDISQVVHVHLEAFPGFFLTMLGPAFLKTMYKAFLKNPRGVFIVEESAGVIRGFAVGAMPGGGKDRNMAFRYAPHFVLAIIPGLLKDPIRVLRRIVSQLVQSGGSVDIPDGSAVLRSIGVLPQFRGIGVAMDLMRSFEKESSQRGAVRLALTTDAANNERAIRFYKKCGFSLLKQFSQDNRRLMFLFVKDLGA